MSGERTTIGVFCTTRDRLFDVQCEQHLKTMDETIRFMLDKLANNSSDHPDQEKAHV